MGDIFEMKRIHWIIGVLGFLLFLSPFYLGLEVGTFAFWSSIILGLIVFLVAIYKALWSDVAVWGDWIVAGAALLLLLTPLYPGIFAFASPAFWLIVSVGTLVLILSGAEALHPHVTTPVR